MATSVLIRIALRYLSAFLVAKGVLAPGLGELVTYDPDVAILIESGAGLAIAGMAEGWYWLAKKFGWAT